MSKGFISRVLNPSFQEKVNQIINQESPFQLEIHDNFFCYRGLPRNEFTTLTQLTGLTITSVGLTGIGCLTSLQLINLDLTDNDIYSFSAPQMTKLTSLTLDKNPLSSIGELPPNLLHFSLKDIDFRSFVPIFKAVTQLKNLTSLNMERFAPWRESNEEKIEELQQQFDQVSNLEDESLQGIMGERIAILIQQLMNQIDEMTNEIQGVEECDNPLFSFIIASLPKLETINGQKLDKNSVRIKQYSSYKETPVIEFNEKRQKGIQITRFDTELHCCNKWNKIEGINKPRQLDFSPVTGELVVGSLNGEVYIYNEHFPIKTITSVIRKPIYGIGWFRTTQNQSKVVIGNNEGNLFLVNTSDTTCRQLQTIEILLSLHINSNDESMVTTGNGCGVTIFDTNTFNIKHKFDSIHQGAVNVARFGSVDPNLLVTSSHDKTIKAWDLRTKMNSPIQVMKGVSPFNSVGINSNDTAVVAAGKDNYVVRFDLRKGEEVRGLNMKLQKLLEDDNYTRAYFNSENDSVIIASTKQTSLFVCDAVTGRVTTECFFDPSEIEYCDGLLSLRPHPFDPYRVYTIPFEEQDFKIKGLYECDIINSYSH
ncbi:hypothetical protein ENUP19_0305G0055 [Entamoeba nuttalli]|uniref:Leucine-rich repeat and WD repeat-containing protein 1 n=2 Tax=Entamoeba nuttalli TaxID=412467 RepID=K2HCH9_ENTNP|nr:WD domain, G-beta repeat-containing protein [Entamoeba nuttalli P19]EKE40444.1 WD domain, G-beta repeat-containing protein [Entamoeba nuttalli P19]|eukprot:XP_008857230.1 WD domain, G-beta repeat-containing protein [Entamoeba nuttalli P19]